MTLCELTVSVTTPNRRWLPRVRWRVLVAAAVLWCGLMFAAQRHLLFPGQHMDAPIMQARLAVGAETFWLDVEGHRVESWFLPAVGATADDPAPLLVVAHGNAEFIDHWLPLVGGFVNHGLSVLLVEYPGYGRSEGSPSEDSVTEAMVAGYDQAVARPDVDGTRVIGLGRSLGAGAVCALARHRDLSALVLTSAFTSVAAMAEQFFLPGFAVLDPFDNEAVLASYDGPLLLFHGEDDDVVPYAEGQRLSQVARDVSFVTWDCRHNDCPPDWDAFCMTVHDWLAKRGIVGAR